MQELAVGGIARRARRMAPEGRNWNERYAWNEGRLITRVSQREVEIRLGRHVKERHFDRAKRFFQITAKARSCPDIMTFPGAHLQNDVVRIGAGNESRPKPVQYIVEGGAGLCCCAP